MQSLVENIKEKPEAHWTVPAMAKELSVCTRSLTRIFSKEYGIAPIDMVIQELMALAQTHLSETDMNIEAVAKAVGYESVPSFTRLFTRIVGKSPKECRVQK